MIQMIGGKVQQRGHAGVERRLVFELERRDLDHEPLIGIAL